MRSEFTQPFNKSSRDKLTFNILGIYNFGLGQNSKNNFISFLVQMRTRKFAFEIYWPLVAVRFCVGWKLASGGRNTNTINACICDVPRRYVCTVMHSHTYLVWKTTRLNVYIYSGLFWGENWPKNGTGKNVWFIGYVVDYKQTLHFGSVILYQHVHEK